MATFIIQCPGCNKALWLTETSYGNRTPKVYQQLRNYTQHHDESYELCKCDEGKKLKAQHEKKTLDLETVLEFGKHKGKTLQEVIETDVTYVTDFLLPKTDWDISMQADFHLIDYRK